jgi:hypothetical protein
VFFPENLFLSPKMKKRTTFKNQKTAANEGLNKFFLTRGLKIQRKIRKGSGKNMDLCCIFNPLSKIM